MLAESGAVDSVTVGILSRMAKLRNTLVQSSFVSSTTDRRFDDAAENLTYESAKTYLDIARRVAELLNSLAAK
jgi:uncharacterized protein YutE (UPF0331/DUF86 family)